VSELSFALSDLRGLWGFDRTVFEGADLSDSKLQYADLSSCSLAGATLFKADLQHSNLTNVDVAGADLSRIKLGERELSVVRDIHRAVLSDEQGALRDGIEANRAQARHDEANRSSNN